MSKVFKKVIKSIGDSLNIENNLQAIFENFSFNNLLNSPIGIFRKNYGYMRLALQRNIGNPFGYNIDNIGEMSYLNYNTSFASFNRDIVRNSLPTYREYVNELRLNEKEIIRNYDFNSNDTLIGLTGREQATRYLNINFNNSSKDNDITSGIYNNFNYRSKTSYLNDKVKEQKEMTEGIPWSTSDNSYDNRIAFGGGNKNRMGVSNLDGYTYGNYSNITDDEYHDKTKGNSTSNIYYPFGNFHSITYSNGLYSASSEKTKEYISKSMLGYSLFDETNVDISKNDVTSPYKKYYATNGSRGSNYLDKISGVNVKFVEYKNDDNVSNVVRLEFPDMGNDNLMSSRILFTYGEMENGKVPLDVSKSAKSYNDGTAYGKHKAYNSIDLPKKDIIHYTNKKFQEGAMKTIISRFHTDSIGKKGSRENSDITSTALSQYGMSHGRNLLKVTPDDPNGYNNPYCRVWTYHHQYGRLKDTIRPFDVESGMSLENTALVSYRTAEGMKKLSKYGSKGKNGLVKIAPTKDDDSPNKNNVKRCMFSIENLAWKGEKNFFVGHEDQKGPLGGRIMWFPPYDLKFSESVGVNWNPNNFIGRGEAIYTYTNTERKGDLSFKILIDHPSIVNKWRSNGANMGGEGIGDVDDIGSKEQQLLRFFAGCDILKAKEADENNDKNAKVKTIDIRVEEPKLESKTTYDELVFYVFYPNNYSGVDDDPSGIVSPMEYLINGYGANKYIDNNDKVVDLGTTFNQKFNGYEMDNVGISGTKKDNVKGSNALLAEEQNIKMAYQYVRSNKVGKENHWAYRCDKKYENQVLHTYNGDTKVNYYDLSGFSLNNLTGYESLVEVHTNDVKTMEEGNLFSFADVFCAIQPEGKSVLTDGTDYDSSDVNIISEKLGLNSVSGYNIVSIDVKGFASSHGYNKSNDELGRNRGKSIVKWLHKCFPNKFDMSMFNYETNEIGQKLSDYNSNSFLAKVWRCSRVSIKIEKEEIIVVSEHVDEPTVNGDETTHNITYVDNKTYEKIQNMIKYVEQNNIQTLGELKKLKGESNVSKLEEIAVANQLEINRKKAKLAAASADKNGDVTNVLATVNVGYRNEYEFFKDLEKEEPFLHDKVVEKIKYFDPAFHSITPEGFQSRLTFLHQCTRQGNTSSNSDINNGSRTANNLAFGRPPVCVLRIGDFFNTKILINSLNINYDDSSWDLNDEGIGVMPMIANVTIGFVFLGGSDLSGPINRLQNSLSFNYYANTSVYDERSEEIEYNSEGEIINFKPKF